MWRYLFIRYLLRFFDCLAHPNLGLDALSIKKILKGVYYLCGQVYVGKSVLESYAQNLNLYEISNRGLKFEN